MAAWWLSALSYSGVRRYRTGGQLAQFEHVCVCVLWMCCVACWLLVVVGLVC